MAVAILTLYVMRPNWSDRTRRVVSVLLAVRRIRIDASGSTHP
jgi:hypothetical protein